MKDSSLNDYSLYLYHQGNNFYSYQMLGAHLEIQDGVAGVQFAVWAPHAKSVSVVGDFNNWDYTCHPMIKVVDGETWTTFIPKLPEGSIYKYSIETQSGERILKADPYAFYAQVKPETASRVYDLDKYTWHDDKWQAQRSASYDQPMLIYEVHLGSWRRTKDNKYLTYREAAKQLIDYVKDMHYTHIEFLPLCEHPFDGSWGYQATGYYAITSRYGEPADFMYLVDLAHQHGIGIIMDWVPGHFCNDAHGLRRFDGQTLYESDNPQLRENYQWGTTNFDYGRPEVQSFLISNALFYLDKFHIDGLRVDAVANMLYLNYGREEGQWTRNKYGDTGNLEAIELIKKLNEAVFKYHPNALMMAEESTSWPMISRPVYMGGMGFNYKWNMGWMNDSLSYMSLDPIYRKWNHDKVTFSLMYAFSENFVLPLSHDEVVHGKCSLINKMPGDYWKKFAGLRAFFGYWMSHPGKKLLFMGGEFGQFIEWNYEKGLDWQLPAFYGPHTKMQDFSRKLNEFYLQNPSLWEEDFDWRGFSWIDCNDNERSILSYVRYNKDRQDFTIVICNFTPEVRSGYRLGVPEAGVYKEVLNSDADEFGGSNVLNEGKFITEVVPCHNQAQSIQITLPPLSTIYFRLVERATTAKVVANTKNNTSAKPSVVEDIILTEVVAVK